jgi:hypothetical protein
MKRTLIMTLVASAFALPVVAIAGGQDKSASANGTSVSSTKDTSSGMTGMKDASPGYSVHSEAFKTADTNGDGFISMEEAKGTPHAAHFTTLDSNLDGKLSQAEFAHAKHSMSSMGSMSSKDQLSAQPATTAAPTTSATSDMGARK